MPWRVLSSLLPRWYVRAWGDAVIETHVEAAGGSGRARGFRFWLVVAGDVVATAVQLRLDAWRAAHVDRSRSRKRGEPMMEPVRHAVRSVLRAPAFSLAVVLTLALGMGVTATLFIVLDRLLLSPPSLLERPAELRRIFMHGVSPFTRQLVHSAALSYPDYEDLRRVRSFRGVAAYSPQRLTLGEAGSSVRIRVELVSANYFALLGIEPQVGRWFTEDDDRVAAAVPVVVLSDAFWRRHFGGAADALGRTLRIGKGSYTVAGVTPRGFTGVDIAPVDVWLPLQTAQAIQTGTDWTTARRWYFFAAVARVPAGAEERAAAEATASYLRGRADVPQQDMNARVVLTSIIAARGPNASQEARVAPALGGLALVVLLIACANVASLLLARGVRRRREFAIQAAIGMGRGAVIRQLLIESVVLALAGGALAILLASLATPAVFRTLMPDAALPTGAAWRVVGFMLVVVVLASVLAGVLPALRSSRLDVLEVLRSTRETARGSSTRCVLLFVQAALCALLLVGAGVFLRSLQRAQQLDMGVDPGTLVVQFELNNGDRFDAAVSYTALERIRSLPVVAAAAVTSIPQFYGNNGISLLANGDSVPSGGRGPFFYGATGSYFDAVGLHLRRGRPLTDADDRAGSTPVAVISESLARAAFADQDPVGSCLYLERRAGERPACTRVVGVVEDFLPQVRAESPNLNLYLPPHHPGIGFVAGGTVVVRARGDVGEAMAAIRAAALAARPDIRLVEVQPLGGLLEAQLRSWRLGAVLLSAFGVLALLVAAAGIYSVLSFDIAQRRFELGVRAALGGSPAALVRTAVQRALVFCGVGILTGMLAAGVFTAVAASLLFQVSAFDPGVYLAAFLTLALATVAAASVPAWRAVRVDPREALRAE